ncbi:hypothetical protein Tco_0153314 [Tanacetum coccineum]
MAFTSCRHGKAKTSQPWITTEEITLCLVQGDGELRHMRHEKRVLVGAMDKKTTQSNPPTLEKPLMPPISLFSTGGSSLQQHTHQPMSPIYSFLTIKESTDEHEICDEYLTDGYLTEKEQHQLLLDEEALRETLEEEARAEK